MMLKSLRARLLFTYTLVILAVLIIIGAGLVLYLVTNPLIDRQTVARLQSAGDALQAQPGLMQYIQAFPQEAVDRIEAATGERTLVYSDRYALIVDSQAGEAAALSRLTPRKLTQPRGVVMADDRRMWLYITRQRPGSSIVVLAAPRRGGLSLLTSSQFREISRDDLLPPFIQAGLVALLLALLMAVWMSRWISAPLQRISAASLDLAQGKHTPIPLDGPGEVQNLAAAFNQMSAQVQASQQSQRDFVANVSHELNTPLTSIQGYAQAILDGAAADPGGITQAAEVIYQESQRMHRMVIELLDLARMDARSLEIHKESLDLEKLLRRVIEKMSLQAQNAQVALVLETDALPAVPGDADRLEQVFTNVIDNALKVSPAGEQISIRVQRLDGAVEVSIRDRGPGIPVQDLERIFDRFYQVDKSRQMGQAHGAGLGLTIAREIIHAHGGTIKACNRSASTPGECGSKFVIILPLISPDSLPA
jgi:signal transduction histidine kinase